MGNGGVGLVHRAASDKVRANSRGPIHSRKNEHPGMEDNTHTDAPQKLSDSDQAKVDAFLARGVNSVDRKPFRPLLLIFLLMAIVAGFSLLSQGIAQWTGIY